MNYPLPNNTIDFEPRITQKTANILSWYANKNNKELYVHLKGVLRYVKETLDLQFFYGRNNYNSIISGYGNSEWGGILNNNKSTTGFVFRLCYMLRY